MFKILFDRHLIELKFREILIKVLPKAALTSQQVCFVHSPQTLGALIGHLLANIGNKAKKLTTQIDVCPKILHMLLDLKCNSLLLFYCAAQCGYVSPLSVAKTVNKHTY